MNMSEETSMIHCHLVKKKKKRFNRDFPQHNTLTYDKHCLQQEISGIVYTTVYFKTCQERAKVHKNSRMHATQAQKGNCSKEHDVMEEYSVLACHQ